MSEEPVIVVIHLLVCENVSNYTLCGCLLYVDYSQESCFGGKAHRRYLIDSGCFPRRPTTAVTVAPFPSQTSQCLLSLSFRTGSQWPSHALRKIASNSTSQRRHKVREPLCHWKWISVPPLSGLHHILRWSPSSPFPPSCQHSVSSSSLGRLIQSWTSKVRHRGFSLTNH